jgi:hypothetical protein
MRFASTMLGAEQPLLDSELLGYGGELSILSVVGLGQDKSEQT